MSKQVYFSFILAALSFFTVKKIKVVGDRHFQGLEILFQKKNGWFNFDYPDFVTQIPESFNRIQVDWREYLMDSLLVNEEQDIIIFNNDSIPICFFWGFSDNISGVTQLDSSFVLIQNQNTLIEKKSLFDTLPYSNFEFSFESLTFASICYDEQQNKVLSLVQLKNKNLVNERINWMVKEFDLTTRIMSDVPLFFINPFEIQTFYNKAKNISKESIILNSQFLPDAIAIHPKTQSIFCFSKNFNGFAIYSRSGELEDVFQLDSKLFSGIQSFGFLQNGDILLSVHDFNKPNSLIKVNWIMFKGY